jgi:hypothetical protein
MVGISHAYTHTLSRVFPFHFPRGVDACVTNRWIPNDLMQVAVVYFDTYLYFLTTANQPSLLLLKQRLNPPRTTQDALSAC